MRSHDVMDLDDLEVVDLDHVSDSDSENDSAVVQEVLHGKDKVRQIQRRIGRALFPIKRRATTTPSSGSRNDTTLLPPLKSILQQLTSKETDVLISSSQLQQILIWNQLIPVQDPLLASHSLLTSRLLTSVNNSTFPEHDNGETELEIESFNNGKSDNDNHEQPKKSNNDPPITSLWSRVMGTTATTGKEASTAKLASKENDINNATTVIQNGEDMDDSTDMELSVTTSHKNRDFPLLRLLQQVQSLTDAQVAALQAIWQHHLHPFFVTMEQQCQQQLAPFLEDELDFCVDPDDLHQILTLVMPLMDPSDASAVSLFIANEFFDDWEDDHMIRRAIAHYLYRRAIDTKDKTQHELRRLQRFSRQQAVRAQQFLDQQINNLIRILQKEWAKLTSSHEPDFFVQNQESILSLPTMMMDGSDLAGSLLLLSELQQKQTTQPLFQMMFEFLHRVSTDQWSKLTHNEPDFFVPNQESILALPSAMDGLDLVGNLLVLAESQQDETTQALFQMIFQCLQKIATQEWLKLTYNEPDFLLDNSESLLALPPMDMQDVTGSLLLLDTTLQRDQAKLFPVAEVMWDHLQYLATDHWSRFQQAAQTQGSRLHLTLQQHLLRPLSKLWHREMEKLTADEPDIPLNYHQMQIYRETVVHWDMQDLAGSRLALQLQRTHQTELRQEAYLQNHLKQLLLQLRQTNGNEEEEMELEFDLFDIPPMKGVLSQNETREYDLNNTGSPPPAERAVRLQKPPFQTTTSTSAFSFPFSSSAVVVQEERDRLYGFLRTVEHGTSLLVIMILLHAIWLLTRGRHALFKSNSKRDNLIVTLTSSTDSNETTIYTGNCPQTPDTIHTLSSNVNGHGNPMNGHRTAMETNHPHEEQLLASLRSKQLECHQLSKELSTVTDELQRLQKDLPMLQEAKDHVTKVQMLNQELQTLLEGKDVQLLNFSTQVQQLNKDLTERESQLANLLSAYANQKDELEHVRSEAEMAQELQSEQGQAKIVELERALAEAKTVKQELEDKLEALTKKLCEQNEEQAKFDAQLQSRNGRIQELEQELNDSKSRSQALEDQLKESQDKSQELETKCQLSKTLAQELEQELENLRKDMSSKVNHMTKESMGRNERETKLLDRLEIEQGCVLALQVKLQQEEDKTQKLQLQLEEIQAHATGLTAKLEGSNARSNALEKKLVEIKQKVEETLQQGNDKIARLESELEESKLLSNGLQEKLQQSTAKCKELELELKESMVVQNKASDVASHNEDQSDEVTELSNALNKLKFEQSQLQSKLKDQEDQCWLLEKQVEHHKALHEKQEQRNHALLENNQHLNEMMQKRNELCSELERKVSELSAQVKRYQARTGDDTSKLDELRKKRQEKQEQAQRLLSTQVQTAHEDNLDRSNHEVDRVASLRTDAINAKNECTRQLEAIKQKQHDQKQVNPSPGSSVGEEPTETQAPAPPDLNDLLSSELSHLLGISLPRSSPKHT